MLVGPEKKDFLVHKELITKRSPFFAAAVSARWERSGDSSSKDIQLPEDDLAVFAEYLGTLYQGAAQIEEEDITKTMMLAIDLYVFADKLGGLRSAYAVLDVMMYWSDENSDEISRPIKTQAPPIAVINHAFALTAPDSPLRRFFVDLYLHEIPEEAFEALELEQASPAFMAQCLRTFAKWKYGGTKFWQIYVQKWSNFPDFPEVPACEFDPDVA